MPMKKLILIFFAFPALFIYADDDSLHTVFIIKQAWHTGIVIDINNKTIAYLPVLKHYSEYDFVDIGWGDDVYWRSENPGWLLAADALLAPTKSVLRVSAFSMPKEYLTAFSEMSLRFELTDNQLKKLSKFIDKSFKKDEDDKLIIIEHNSNFSSAFYRSVYSYHLFNTCNTWVGRAFKAVYPDISTAGLILSKHLYDELKDKAVSETINIIE